MTKDKFKKKLKEKFWNGRFIEIHSGDIDEIINLVEDNPVPSIDNIIKEIYKEHYDMYRRGAYDFPSEEEWVEEQLKMFKLNNPELLQNGVETDKEEPK